MYLVARFEGSFSSLLSVDLKRIKKAWANPSTINHKTTKNGKTSLATPLIIIKYFPNDENTRKNNKNLKVNSKVVIAVICVTWEDWLLIIQVIDVIIGKEYAPTSIISNKKTLIFFLKK